MRVVIALLLGLGAFVPFALFGEGSDSSRTVYLSHVEKNAVASSLVRMATDQGHLVVTTELVEGARTFVTVQEKEGFNLYLIETFPGDKQLPGEQARLNGIAAILLPDSVDHLHDALENPLWYGVRVGHKAQTFDKRKRSVRPITAVAKNRPLVSVDRAFLEEKLRGLSGADPVVIGGDEIVISDRGSDSGRENARLWMEQEFGALGFEIDHKSYGGGVNFVAQRNGHDTTRTLIVSAHFDSVRNAGADDDGGGVILGLAIAKALSETDLAYNLRFVGFDEEERGLVGSAAYVRNLSTNSQLDEIVGVVNIEMPGYDADGDGAMHIIDCNENTSAELTTVFEDVLAREPLDLVKEPACTNRSDHASFWRYDVPAIVVSQNFFGGDSNPCYHRSCDTTARVNFDYMLRFSRLMTLGVADLVAE